MIFYKTFFLNKLDNKKYFVMTSCYWYHFKLIFKEIQISYLLEYRCKSIGKFCKYYGKEKKTYFKYNN